MPEVPPSDHGYEQRHPAGADQGAVSRDPPAAPPDPDPPSPAAPRGPFEDPFSERSEPEPSPVRTPWDPPSWRSADQADPFGAGTPSALTGPYGSDPAGTPPPFGALGGVAAEATVAVGPPRRSIIRPAGRLLRELAETLILALVIFLLVRSVVQNFQVEGTSMEPTLESGWYLLVNKALYWEIDLKTVHKFLPFVEPGADPTRYIFRGPRRGDIVVFRAPEQPPGAPERDFIKRIIGLPGDTVEIKSCTVFVNGQALEEPYIVEEPINEYGPATVPKGAYFVLGDNRNNSSDSRTWGMLPKENIIGQAWVIYWPFRHFGLLNNEKPGSGGTAPSDAKPAPACTS